MTYEIIWINQFFLFQQVNKLEMSNHEEPSFLMSKHATNLPCNV